MLVKCCKGQLLWTIAIQSIILKKSINKNIGHLDMGITNPALICGLLIEQRHFGHAISAFTSRSAVHFIRLLSNKVSTEKPELMSYNDLMTDKFSTFNVLTHYWLIWPVTCFKHTTSFNDTWSVPLVMWLITIHSLTISCSTQLKSWRRKKVKANAKHLLHCLKLKPLWWHS